MQCVVRLAHQGTSQLRVPELVEIRTTSCALLANQVSVCKLRWLLGVASPYKYAILIILEHWHSGRTDPCAWVPEVFCPALAAFDQDGGQ
eukprot:5905697-Amphidinium_carterae.1